MTTMTYDGYIATVTIDLDANVLHGEVVNTRDVLTFSAKSADQLRSAFEETIRDYRDWCNAEGVPPEKPYSGTLTLRLNPTTHRMAAARAAEEGVSLSSWLSRVVDCELGQRPAHVTEASLQRRVQAGVREEVFRVLSTETVLGGEQGDIDLWRTDGMLQ